MQQSAISTCWCVPCYVTRIILWYRINSWYKRAWKVCNALNVDVLYIVHHSMTMMFECQRSIQHLLNNNYFAWTKLLFTLVLINSASACFTKQFNQSNNQSVTFSSWTKCRVIRLHFLRPKSHLPIQDELREWCLNVFFHSKAIYERPNGNGSWAQGWSNSI